MPASLTVISNEHKHEIGSVDPWLLLLQVDIPETETKPAVHVRLANNKEDVVYQGVTYNAFAIDFTSMDQKPGELPSFQVRISNVNREIHSILEEYKGGNGGTATFLIVSAKDLESASPAQVWQFEIFGAVANDQWATITLSSMSPMRIPFPSLRCLEKHCNWLYNSPSRQASLDPLGATCGYEGGLPTCDHTLNGANGCGVHGQTLYFGGHPGVSSPGYKFASVI